MAVRRTAFVPRTGPWGTVNSLIWLVVIHLLQIQATENSTKNTNLICAPGLSTPGATVPQGDIVLEEGQPLEIFCILDMSHSESKGHNASDLRFYRNNTLVASEYVTVINETTLRLYEQRPAVSKTMYYCKLKVRESKQTKQAVRDVGVCLNTVMIGYKPQDVENFNCTSYNWMNLKCTWVPRYNPIPTTYKLIFRLKGSDTLVFGCPNNTEALNMCYWDDETSVPYRQVYEHYYFTFYGENPLGKVKFPIKVFDHYKNIIAGKPKDFSVLNKTSSSFFLEWQIPYPLDSLASSNILEHKIAYAYMGAKEDKDSEEPWHIDFRGRLNCTSWCTYNLTGLRYAHVLYDIRVYLKTQTAPEDYWSEPASTVQRTAASIPPEPPRMDIGSFEVSGRLPNRDVTIYWQSLPEKLHAGNNFSYKIIDVLQNGLSVPIKANVTGKKLAILRNISCDHNFTVRVAASNALGLSPTYSEIYIPSGCETLREPRFFTKTSMNNGVFKLTWEKPERSEHLIKNYTIFWCDSQNDRPETCTGFLNWTHVDSSTRNVSLSLKPIMYHFAISANSERDSSGMVWASCSMLSDKVDKLKSVWVKTYSATSMSVGWKLDCTDANNVVRGFQIFYCVVKDKEGQQCKDAEKNLTITGNHTMSMGTLLDLQPYRTYKASVAIVTKIGAGLKSDPVFCTLSEAAPASPPTNIEVFDVTNSSMVVSWSPPPNPNGVLRYYEVHFNGNVTKVLVDNPIDESKRTQVVLKDLTGFTNYTIQVKACTTSCSDLSDPIVIKTLIGAPGDIGVLKFGHVNYTLLIVSWDPPKVRGGKLDYYLLSVERISSEFESEPPEVSNVTGTQYQVHCNSGGSPSFKFSVRAVNVDGDKEFMGPWSETLVGSCLQDTSILYYVLIAIVAGVAITSAVGAVVAAKSLLKKCREMKHIPVKIPEGLTVQKPANVTEFNNDSTWGTGGSDSDGTKPAPDKERLLEGKEDRRGESSGCSSGHDTASSSTTSGTHISIDSGTEVDQHEPVFNDSSTWQANVNAIGGQKRDKLIQPPWANYQQIGELPDVDKKPPICPGYSVGMPAAIPLNGYVAMTGTGTIPDNVLKSPNSDISPAAAPQTKASSGYVAHNALPTQAPWSNPAVADGYVQMGRKPAPSLLNNDEGVVMKDDQEDEVRVAAVAESEMDTKVPRTPAVAHDAGVSTSVGDERTSAEEPLVPKRNGYVSHSFPIKNLPVRHGSARTEEKSPPISMLDSAKSYMRVGELASSAPRPEVFGATKTSASLGYVPHKQFETRSAPGVVRD